VLLDQSPFDIQQLKGQPFLLHFWASWCPVCRLEEGSIDALAKDYPVITVASWSDDVASYMEENKLSFPVLSDPDGDLAAVYGIKGVPASFFVDAQGRIQFVEIGYTSEIGFRLRLWWLQL
jgi:thiol-disulfide isomerase/thioredoxin